MRDGFAGPTTSTRTRSRQEEAGRGACPPPANDVHRGIGGMQFQHDAFRGHVDIDDSTNFDQHDNCVHVHVGPGQW